MSQSDVFIIPTSFSQQRLWLLDQLQPGNPAYNMPAAARLSGNLNVAALEQSLQALIQRHETLRTTFCFSDGEPMQVISPPFHLSLPRLSLEHCTPDTHQAALDQIIASEAQLPFDLEHGPLLRVKLVRLGESEHVLVLVLHHIISDGWSLGVLVRELSYFYNCYAAGEQPQLEALAVQYADYALWQREWLSGAVLEQQLEYWRKQLGGTMGVLELPSEQVRPAVQSYRGGSERVVLGKELSRGLKELSRGAGATLYMTLLAGFEVLLQRYTGAAEVSVGTPVAGRSRPEVEDLIGLFVNTLVVRNEVRVEESFRELLGRVRRVTLAGYAHEEVPFEKVLEELQPERSLSHSPLFQVYFNMLNFPDIKIELSGLTVELLDLPEINSKFDLTMYVKEKDDVIQLELVYNRDLFEPPQMIEMLAQYEHLLAQIVEQPEKELAAFSLRTPRARMLLPDPTEPLDEHWEGSVHTLFTRQARRLPKKIAVADEEESWTYEQLDLQSNRLASYLIAHGVRPQDVVAIYAHRSASLVLALLGIFKAGAAFVILDPEYPTARLIECLEIAQPRGWLQLEAAGVLPEALEDFVASSSLNTCRLVLPAHRSDFEQGELASYPVDPVEAPVGPDDMAYVAFTSGTTGKPKGIIGRHGSLTHFLPWLKETFNLNETDRFSMLSGLSHDPLHRDIFTPMQLGATVVIPNPEHMLVSEMLVEWANRQQITVAHLTPAMGQILTGAVSGGKPPFLTCSSLRYVFLVGDILTKLDVQRLRELAPSMTCVNYYGSTETQRAVGHFIVPAEKDDPQRNGHDKQVIPLGRGIRDVQLLVINSAFQLAGFGETGDIFVRSPHIAKGYLNDDRLTQHAFIINPFTGAPGDWLYRTGDLGRYMMDGNVEPLGRNDQQVKIRGYRIELGEIEAALQQHEDVLEAVVVARGDGPHKQLAAYVVPVTTSGEPATSQKRWRDHLKERLPDYMIPSSITVLEKLPLTTNGKVDRTALPDPEQNRTEEEENDQRELTAVETEVKKVWMEVLGVEVVRVNDNFFELGGHSLLATQVIARLRQTYSRELSLRELFESPTVAGLAARVETMLAGEQDPVPPAIERVERAGPLPLSFAQQRLWFLHQLDQRSSFFNMHQAVRLKGVLNIAALEQSLNEVLRRHEALRTKFVAVDGLPVQVIEPPQPFSLALEDLSGWTRAEQETKVLASSQEESHHAFDLTQDPLLRIRLLRLDSEEHVVLLTMHHIISDGWSMTVFFSEMSTLYAAFSEGLTPTLTELPIQYADYAVWQRNRLQDEALAAELSYWKKQLAGAPPALDLPVDHPTASQLTQGARYSVTIPDYLVKQLESFSLSQEATPFIILLAALKILLFRWTRQKDMVVGTVVANRDRVETENLIGCFMNFLPLRTETSEEETGLQLLRRIKNTVFGMYAHHDCPFEKIVKAANPKRRLDQNSLYNVAFLLQNFPRTYDFSPALEASVIPSARDASSLDLRFIAEEYPEAMRFWCEYRADLFEAETIKQLLEGYCATLEKLLNEPQLTLSSFTLPEELEARAKQARSRNSPQPLKSEKSQLFSRIALDWSDPEQVLKVIENRKRRARPELETNFVEPSDPIHKQLAEIWIEVLGIDRVGIHDNFFELGGDSLLATQVVSRIRDLFRVELPLHSSFELPTVAGLAERIERHLEASGEETTGKIEPRKQNDTVPLSFAQQRLWFMDQLEPESAAYNITASLRLRGALEVKALERAFNEVVRRHETLRTSFENDNGRLRQLISPELLLRIPILDLTELPEAEQETEVRRVTGAEAQRPFDLTQPPLLRVTLARLRAEEFVMLYAIHHIIADGWSLGVLIAEVVALYEAFLRGADSPLAELPIQYGDYAVWQQQWFKGEKLQTQLDYWKKQLSGAVPLLELPMAQPRPKVQSYRGAQMPFNVPAVLTEQLRKLSQAEGVTLFMTLLAAFQVLLYRYSGMKDIVVGTATANRRRVETEKLIGCFLNMLALRTDLSGNPRFSELLVQVKEMTLAAYANQDAPFERVVEELQLERSLDHAPLFQYMLLLQNAQRQELHLPGLTMTAEKSDTGTAKLDFTLALNEVEDGLAGWLEYNTDLFSTASAAQLLEHLRVLLEGIAARPFARLSELPLLTGSERRRLLVEWNQTNTDYALDQPVHRLIEAQAAQAPDRVAVRFEQEQLTYRELNERANQLAHYLGHLGVEPEVRVGVMLDRSLDMVVALLGVLKAGGAYVPLDPAYPERRLSFLIADAELSVLLTEKHLNAGDSMARVVALEREWERIACESRDNPSVVLSENNIAYLIYTSGSTGVPKGVQITHGSLINLLRSMSECPGMSAGETLLAVTTLSFDIAGLELYLPLIVGGEIVLMSRDESGDALRLSEALVREGASVMQATPVTWQMLLAAGWNGAAGLKILCGGEALTRDLADRLVDHGKTVWNLYGPTETTIWSAVWQVAAGTEPVYIGRPISNTQLYILDEHLEPVPVDVTGHLYIGGAGLSRGYWRRSELTAEKFIPDPFSAVAGARLYRTGDMARYRADGEIEFLGRVDQQVKVRGFRIELGEVETVLKAHPSVLECVVVAREAGGAGKSLVAYFVSRQEVVAVRSEELRAHLRQRLPEYMVPPVFVPLAELPLTPNGKIDRRALPEPEEPLVAAEQYEAPRTEIEAIVAGIWSEVLKVSRVGAADNFFELGGHSLLATQVLAQINRAFGIELRLWELFEYPQVRSLATQVEAQLKAGVVGGTEPLRRVARGAQAALSFAQQRLWFLDQLEPGSAAYNIPVAVRLRGELQVEALERAFNEVVRRHEVLRTTFANDGGQATQVIHAAEPLPLPLIDLSALPSAVREQEAQQLVLAEALRAFDLARGPLLRVRLVRLGAEEHVAQLTMHHIIADEWSLGVLVRELGVLYEAFRSGRESPLFELPIQYADYAVWQKAWLREEVLAAQLRYWQQQLSGAPALLELPADWPRRRVQGYDGAVHRFSLSKGLSGSLQELSRREGVTLFMTLLAAWQVLLARYSGVDDVSVGTPIAGRGQVETQGLVGFFVNTLVLRTKLDGEPSFREVLQRVREVALGAYAHQEIPFEKLVEELQPQRELSYAPLFQVMLVLQNTPAEVLALDGVQVSSVKIGERVAKFDLTLTFVESEAGISGTLEYKTELFEAATIARLVEHLRVLLEEIVAAPERNIHRLPLLRAEERQRLLQEWSESGRAYEEVSLLHELFEQQVERSPEAIALVYQEQQLSYGELNRRANQLAHYLRGKGVGPEVLVGICIERSLEMVVALLGVLKSGGAYVPLDPTYPKERLLFMLQDTKAPVLLTEQRLVERMPCHQAKVVCLDTDWNEIAQESTRDPISGATAGNSAYVIYTSGSTGRPKGVVVDHQNVVRLFAATDNWFHFAESDVWTLFHSYAFDFSVWELWGALLYGGRLVVVPYLVSRSPEEFYDLLCTEQVTVLNQTPSAFRQLIEAEKSSTAAKELALRFVIFGGEALELESIKPWFSKHTDQFPRLINMYGITETTVHVTYFPLSADFRASGSVIGVRIPDLSVYVLNEQLQPVPEKVADEIFVGGAGLGRGYLNRPELTAEKFIPNPFAGKPGERLYRAGDLARYLPDGNLEYVGRVDHQVKIRGFRIELGEIETALMAHPSVRECVVVAREDVSEGKCLVAYIVSSIEGEAVANGELRRCLQEQLPEYMVPSLFVRLESLPLTPNGKIDRRALPEPDLTLPATAQYVPARTETEAMVAGIWSEVLKVSQVGVEDNFFELGGHSLLATQVLAQINRVFGIQLPLRELFEHPRVADLATQVEAQLRAGGGSAAVPLQRVERGAQVALSFAQQRLWFLDQLEPGSAAYNLPVAVRLRGELQVEALERAFNEVVRRHEALRTTFEIRDWDPVQVIAARPQLRLAATNLEGFAEQQREAEIERVAVLAAREPFELQHWPLFRVKLLRVNAKEHVLVLVLHHIISDGWSMGVLVRELGAFYAAFVDGRQPELHALEVQYADYAVWQRKWLRGPVLKEQLRYWQEQLRGASPTLELPTREQSGDIDDIRGASFRLAYDEELTAELKQLSQREGVTLFMVLLAALSTLLYRYSGQSDIVVGTGVANRSQPELKDLIGFFVNVLPLRTDLSGNPTFRELLQRVWKTALGAYAHQEMPFEKIVEELQPERTRSHSPLFRVVLVLNNMVLPALELPDLSLSPMHVHSGTSHFDLTLTLMETEQGLRGTVEYKTALFSAALVEQLLVHYEQVLRAVIKDPEQRLLEIELAAGAAKTVAAGNLEGFAEVFANDQFSFDVS